MSHITCQCQGCTAWNPQGTCTEQKSPYYGGDISPFHIACNQYLSRHTVFAPKNMKRKKWFRAKTLDDLEIPGARLWDLTKLDSQYDGRDYETVLKELTEKFKDEQSI